MSKSQNSKILAELLDSSQDDDDIIPATQEKAPTKRKHKENEIGNEKKQKLEIPTAFVSLLHSTDTTHKLAIHSFMDDYHSDVLVQEYIDNMLIIGHSPLIPNQQELEAHAVQSTFSVTSESSIALIKNFMSFFQGKYFQNNVTSAQVYRKHVFNPIVKMSVPAFQLFPKQTHEQFTLAKESLAMQIEGCAVLGSMFTSELLILRNMRIIFDECTEKRISDENMKRTLDNIFAIHYLKAKMEFVSKFNIKIFDWENKDCKIRHIQPKWRSENLEPPKTAFNHYATHITKKIEAGEENFNGKEVLNSFHNFLTNGMKSLTKAKSRLESKSTAFPESSYVPSSQRKRIFIRGLDNRRKNDDNNNLQSTNVNHERSSSVSTSRGRKNRSQSRGTSKQSIKYKASMTIAPPNNSLKRMPLPPVNTLDNTLSRLD